MRLIFQDIFESNDFSAIKIFLERSLNSIDGVNRNIKIMSIDPIIYSPVSNAFKLNTVGVEPALVRGNIVYYGLLDCDADGKICGVDDVDYFDYTPFSGEKLFRGIVGGEGTVVSSFIGFKILLANDI